jgi:hypothetical protein
MYQPWITKPAQITPRGLLESTTARRVKYRIGGTLCRLPGTTVVPKTTTSSQSI